MARITIRVDELIVVVRVTNLALDRQMGTGQNKSRRIVVERSEGPRNC
jgi:hypothetical protein